MLDVGCGWGSFAIHAATRQRSPRSSVLDARPSRRRGSPASAAAEAGVGDRVEIRVADYRDLAGERLRRDRQHRHGRARRRPSGSTSTPSGSRRLLGPGGRLLNHGIARRSRHTDPDAGPFSERYVVPRRRPAAPVARRCRRSSALGSSPSTSTGFAARLRRDAAPLGRRGLDEHRRSGGAASPAPSACGSGASSCAADAQTASRPGVTLASTRCSPGAGIASPGRRGH